MSLYIEDVEKIFTNDIRDKKRTGRGAFAMRGKGVKHGMSGALKTPYYYMSAKEKKKLNGEVEVRENMYSTILNWNEFQAKDTETQKQLLEKWREFHPNQKIMDELAEGMGKKFNTQSFADLVNSLGCKPKRRGGSTKKATANSKKKTPKKKEEETNMNTPVYQQPQQIATQAQTLLTKGLHLEYNGTYDVEALNRLFTKLSLIVEGETSKYNISLSLTEIEKD